MNRVVITGLGAVTPVGNDIPTTWNNLLAGQSGVTEISRFDASDHSIRIAGEVKEFRLAPSIDPREARRMSLHVQYAINAVLEAVAMAELDMQQEDPTKVGVIYGTGAGGIDLIIENQKTLDSKGPRRVSPLLIANMIDDAASGHLSILLGARGPNMAVVSACSTGGQNIGEAFEIIRRGDASVIITGGSESPINPLVLAAFTNMKGLAVPAEGEPPMEVCKPFDARRSGFILSEGAGALVLEDLNHARQRGAPILAEVVGQGNASDAVHMAAPDEQGVGITNAVRMALRKAGIQPTDVGYINAHGTGTMLNDKVETYAVKQIFGEHASQLAISSTKSMLGHMMGGAGAIEAVISTLVLKHGRIPPTINYATPDPDCDLDYVPNHAREMAVEVALSNSIGLGGHNACLALKRFEE